MPTNSFGLKLNHLITSLQSGVYRDTKSLVIARENIRSELDS